MLGPLGQPAEEPLGAQHADAAQILRMFTDAYEAMSWRNTRIETTRDLRRGTLMVGVNPKWAARFRQAEPFVQSLLPERRTLERSVKASAGAVEPQISRAATGETGDDDDHAEWAEFYLNELRTRRFPSKQCFGKSVEDGEYAFCVIPDAATMDGQPLYADTITAARYKALKPAEKQQYIPYGVNRTGADPRRYVKLAGAWSDGTPKEGRNPEYDRDASGRRRDDKYYAQAKGAPRASFKRDEARSAAAFDEHQRRYRAAHLPITALLLPALDVAPLLVRSKDGERWALRSMITRQLLGVEEAQRAGYRWAGMGDRLLLPMGDDANRMSGQRGMFYLYQLYMEEYDDAGRCHPLILSTVLGINGQTKATDATGSNVDVLDLYDEWGIDFPLWDYCGGMATDDDSPAFAYEPWMWPFVNRILKIEGVETLTDMAMWENGNTGYLQEPNPQFSDDVVLDASGNLRTTAIPDPGEVVQSTGPVHPFAEQRVNPDFRYREQALRDSLASQTIAEQSGGDAGASGHQLVVQHTLSVVAKDDIRAGVLRACRLFVRASARILDALAERGVNWPIETSEDRPIGSKSVSKGSLIEWSRDWLGGSYEFAVTYPEEANPVAISLAEQAWVNGSGTWEDLQKAKGKNDAESERLKVAEDSFWKGDYGKALLDLRVAEFRQDAMSKKIAKLRADKALAATGLPGMEGGVPTGLLGGDQGGAPGAMQPQQPGAPGVPGAPSPQQLVGSIVGSNSGAGPAANDARAVSQIAGGASVGAGGGMAGAA